jgi:hypothetical protein
LKETGLQEVPGFRYRGIDHALWIYGKYINDELPEDMDLHLDI